MAGPLRIVQVNLAYDSALTGPDALLDRYHTLTGWSVAVAHAGASVRVVQRFSANAAVTRDGIHYTFCSDGGPPVPPPSWVSRDVLEAAGHDADVVHVNGLMFPAMTRGLRDRLPGAAIVVQDHSGRRPPGLLERVADPSWRQMTADAWSFTAAAHAQPWREAGLPGPSRVLEIVEAGPSLERLPREEAQRLSGVHGRPSILWVGRLNANKDPLTVLDGLERAFDRLPDARCWMVYGDNTLEGEVRDRIARSRALADRVTLAGPVPHEEMARYYSAADFYVSGSHREGSGYALIEAMSCGARPVITDIPSFRVIAGDVGAFWRPGDAAGFAAALVAASALDRDADTRRVVDRFDRTLSWTAIAARTLEAYRMLHAERVRTARS